MTNKDEFFSGPDEFKKLKDTSVNTLAEARTHIRNLILRVDEDDVLSPPEEEEARRTREAHKNAHFLFSIEQSLQHLPGYATLDHDHIKDIIRFTSSVEDYASNKTRSKPINFMMLGAPGEGKSHFIDCIAKKLGGMVKAVVFNMASMRETGELASALDRARNVAVEGKVPLLFLDEFDSNKRNFSLLLPLLWDGEIELGTRSLKIGRCVIVLAGSNPALPDLLGQATSFEKAKPNKRYPKLDDLFSRINGDVITIPSLTDATTDATYVKDRRIDKVCVATALLRRTYGGDGLKWVPASLLCFIYNAPFKYGVRSIKHFIEFLGHKSKGVVNNEGFLNIDGLKEIFGKVEEIQRVSLAYHLFHPEKVKGIKSIWDDSLRRQHMVPIWCEAFKVFGRPTTWEDESAGSFAMQMILELEGKLEGGKPRNLSTLAAIKPHHITQLWLTEETGEWDRGHDKLRHVFFNLRTLQQLLLEIKEPDSPGGVGKESDSPNDDTRLKRVGHRMGIEFGLDFVKFLPLTGERLEAHTIETLISHWCQFDISGGWGKWVPKPDSHEPDIGELHVFNNFLAVPVVDRLSQNGKSPFCPIMEGYIQGVLEKIIKALHPEDTCSVEVNELGCSTSDLKKPCRFMYKIKGLSLS